MDPGDGHHFHISSIPTNSHSDPHSGHENSITADAVEDPRKDSRIEFSPAHEDHSQQSLVVAEAGTGLDQGHNSIFAQDIQASPDQNHDSRQGR